jgi:hypothetical protein
VLPEILELSRISKSRLRHPAYFRINLRWRGTEFEIDEDGKEWFGFAKNSNLCRCG